MKNEPLIGTLVGVLALCALASVVLCYLYVAKSRELRALQGQVMLVTNRRAAFNALIVDSIEYSKKNSAINPILEAIGATPAKPAPATTTNKPATK